MGRLTAAAAVGLILAVVAWTLRSPKTVCFVSPPNGPWVRVNRPFDAQPFGDAALSSDFRHVFELKEPVSSAVLRISAPYEVKVLLDDNVVEEWVANRDDWKKPREVTFHEVAAGRHELMVRTVNHWGPNAISVQCESIPELSTATGWEGAELTSAWKPVVSVEERPLTEVARAFPSSLEAIQQLWPVLIGVAAAVVGGMVYCKRLDDAARERLLIRLTEWICRGSLIAFGVLAANNTARGWAGEGFDYPGHVDYVSFIATEGSLPLPKDGLQMFQSPLYYALGAVVVKVVSLFVGLERAIRFLVLINLACGFAQIEICSRALKAVFPDRPIARSLGMVVGCLLPMNVYFSHYVGNQPLEGMLTGLALMLTVESLAATEWASGKRLTLIGAVIGLALLAKVNAVVPAAVIVAALMIRSAIDQRSAWMTGEDLFFLVSPILAIAGWYYFRNWLNFGRPFLGGWGADAAFKWWQDRGFNTPRDLTTIGTGVLHPVYAGFGSLWDGFYSSMWVDAHLGGSSFESRPRWNDSFMVSSALVGVVPTLGMLIGAVIPFVRRREARPVMLFASVVSVALIGVYITFNLQNPCFASAKAFYVIGGLPCFAILAGLGLEGLAKVRWLRPVIVGAIACVPVWSLASYFIVR